MAKRKPYEDDEPAGAGHNSGGSFAADQLKSFVERIEKLEDEKSTVAEDIKDVYAEAKGNGFDTKVLREVIKIRKQDKAEREERMVVLDRYLNALGMSL